MYSDYIKLNENFRSSVNLDFDLNNITKINNYIITKNLCDVIKYYFESINSSNHIRSNLLFGPYGKGKSYLLLIISYLLSADSNEESYINLLSKIKSVDIELYNLIINKRENNKLLTVVITMSNNISFEQNMLLSLQNSLKRFNIENININSMYEVALSLLNTWNNEYNNGSFNNFYDILNNLNLEYDELYQNLESYEEKSINDFKKIYESITHGVSFNPLINNNIYKIYEEVALAIKNYNYNGLFIIIDEFGLFIEQGLKDNLYQFQNFCEKCNNTESTNMYLTCIMHKELNLYNNYKLYEDDLKKIEGRFHKLKFNSNSDDNFYLIANNIINTKNINSNLYDKYQDILFINNKNILSKCFPFNPYSLYALVIISEKIAQNERSLFTFLNDNHDASLLSFINNNNSGLLTLDYIYDYFKETFNNDDLYNKLYIRCESLLRHETNINLIKIIKALFIFLLVNDNILFKATIENLALSLDLDFNEVNSLINENIKNNIFRFDDFDHSITYSLINSDFLNNLLNKYINKIDVFDGYSNIINKYNDLNYVYSNKYNFEFKMCRYYKNIFLDYNTFKCLNDFNILLEEADGLIINIFNINDSKDLLNLYNNKENNSNVIIRYSKLNLSENIISNLIKLEAIDNILIKEVLDNILIDELNIYKKSLIYDLNRYLEKFYLNASLLEDKDLNTLLYDKLINTYNKTLIFNYEAVNRHNLTKMTYRSIFNIIENNLNKSNIIFSDNSAENSINKAFITSLNYEISKEIINIISAEIKSNNLNNIYNILSNKPYKLRIGVILLYIAYYITNISNENYILVKNDMEIELEASSLKEALLDKNYIIQKIETNDTYNIFRKDISNYLNINFENNYNTDVNILKALERKVYNLDQIILNSNKDNNILDLDKNSLRFKDMLLKKDLNPYEFLYSKLIKLFKVNINELSSKIIKTFNKYQEQYEKYLLNIISDILDILKIKDLYEYKDKYININYDNLNDKDIKIDKLLRSNNKLDFILLNDLSLLLINKSLNNYSNISHNLLLDSIKEYLNNLYKKDIQTEEAIEISIIGKTLESNLLDTISEYGDSITKEEKIAILLNIIRGI